MLISNIKESDPKKVYGNGLIFNDGTATSEEIIQFINKVPQEIKALQFSDKSVVPLNFGKIKKLDSLLITLGGKQNISEAVLNIPIVRLDLRRWSQNALSLNFFQNSTINKMFIYGDYESLPAGDYNLPNVEMLYLQSENLSYIPEGKHFLPSLKSLNIFRGKLKSIPASFLEGEKLEDLNITSPELQSLPNNLSRCTALRSLSLSGPLSEGIPDLIDSSLQRINAYKLKGEEYAQCRLPKTLEFANFQADILINSFPDLSHCTNLSTLSLNIGKNYPKLASDLPSLRNLSCSRISDTNLPKELDTATNLEAFHLMKCPIKSFPSFLLDCAALTKLQLYAVDIEELPQDWKSCVNLEILTIESNSLKVPSLDFAHSFKKLKIFNLSQTVNYSLTTGVAGHQQVPILGNKYSLIGKKLLPLHANSSILRGCRFITVHYGGGGKNKTLKPQTFLDFCAALGKTKLTQTDKEYFFDLLWETRTVQELPVFNFPTFLKALNINFKPLAQVLQRRLVREVLLQHFVNMKLVKSPVAFESYEPDKFLLQSDSKPMLENIRTFLRNDMSENVILGLQMLKTGGVPVDMAEELLLLAKTHEEEQVRLDAKDLLKDVVPDEWQELLKNQLVFYHNLKNVAQGFWEKQLRNLADKTTPELAAFFALLVRSKHNENSGTVTDIDEFLFSVAESLGIEDKLLEKGAVVFVNGTTTLKKGEIKDKLEAIGIKYATKYSDKVTHVLVGKNPSEFDIQRADVQILIENYLQKYLSQTAPDFLEQAEQEGDTAMFKSVMQFLESEDANSALVGLEMLKTGGVPESVLPALLVMQKSYDNAKVRGAAKKLLERYGPAKWLPLLSSRLIFKSIGKGAKETDNYNRLIKLEKEISFETAAELSLLFYQKYQRGLRFLVKRGTKGGAFHMQAYQAMYREECLHLSSGVGYTDWRTRGNFDNYYGSTGMVSMSISFPKDINELGKIREIDLHNVKVKAMPKGITNLVDLQKIDASFNGLKSLPQGLKKLNKLEELDLSFNDFSDFPDRVVELRGLKKLDLRNQKNKQLKIPESVQKALPDCEILV